jgi:hypothetical protein
MPHPSSAGFELVNAARLEVASLRWKRLNRRPH